MSPVIAITPDMRTSRSIITSNCLKNKALTGVDPGRYTVRMIAGVPLDATREQTYLNVVKLPAIDKRVRQI